MHDPANLSLFFAELDGLEAETFEVKDYTDSFEELSGVASCCATSSTASSTSS